MRLQPHRLSRPLLVTLAAVCLGLVATTGSGDEGAPPLQRWHTGSLFRRELERPVNIIRTGIGVREILSRLAEIHQVAMLLDRRIDPDRRIDVQLSHTTLLEGLQLLAGQWDAEAVTLGSTVYIGPSQAVDRSLTLVQRLQGEIRERGNGAAGRQAFELSQGHTFRWDDLARPIDIVQDMADRGDIQLLHTELVPHDLWAGGVMADVSVVEGLTIVLGQYDLAFHLSPDGREAELYHEAGRVTFERPHVPRTMTTVAAAEQIRAVWPLLPLKIEGPRLVIDATALEHARIAEILTPAPRSAEPAERLSLGPLSQRRFTFQVVRRPFSAVIRTLEANDIVVDYDADALREAGIDLDKKVSLQLEQATPDELFEALCSPLGLEYRITGKTVHLSAAP